MDIKVKSLYLKTSPRKVRPVLHGLRGQNAEKAMTSLLFTNRKGAGFMADLLKSGMAAAKENDLDFDKLYVKAVSCNEGPTLKRRLIGSRGRSDAIHKRMCHLNLVLSDIAEAPTKNEIKKNELKEKKDIKSAKKIAKEDK